MIDNLLPSRHLRVLVADDSDLVREMVRAILEQGLSADCSCARDLGEALDIAANRSIHLALLDYNMPGMNGLQGVTRMMKQDVRNVALLSGRITSDVVQQAVGLGVSGFIPKALPPRKMVGAVRAMSLGKKFAADHFLGDMVA